MQKNRSVPVDTVMPHVVYNDVGAALAWLTRTFGLVEHFRYGDPANPEGAQARLGAAWVMLERARPGRASPAQTGSVYTQMLSIFVDDVAAHFARVAAAGAAIFEELNDTVYGERQYGAVDLEGHRWLFSEHVRDLNPDEWGATIA